MSLIDPNESYEEMHERVTKLLKTRSNPLICISCGEEILPGEELVSSIHGPYHGYPRGCVDGQIDYDGDK